MNIEIINRTDRKVRRIYFQEQIHNVLKKSPLDFSELSVAFISGSEIRALNKRYRQKDKITDVLSFDYGDSCEIVICLSQAKKQAQEAGHSLNIEILALLIHALLHLKGYDHEDDDEGAEIMAKKEYDIMKYLQEKG